MADVATLAAPEFSGRLAGSPGYEAAARWAARRFGRLGLESPAARTAITCSA